MENFQIIGAESLNDSEKEILAKLTREYFPKIQREIKNITSIVLHIKSQSKGGKRKRHTINLRTIIPSRIFESSATSWDLSSALHKSFREIVHEIQHRFKDR